MKTFLKYLFGVPLGTVGGLCTGMALRIFYGAEKGGLMCRRIADAIERSK